MKLTLKTPSKSIHWLTQDELKASRLATAWIDRASPILVDAQPNGLAGLAIDEKSASASQFSAKTSAALTTPVNGRPAKLEASFAYRRGGAKVMTTLTARDAETGAALDLPGAGAYLIFYPQGVALRASRLTADAPPSVSAPLRSFCRMRRAGGRGVVSFIADNGALDAPHPAPIVLSLKDGEGTTALLDEACPPKPLAARAADARHVPSGATAQ
jgi:hypothetical protein